jgi:GST-like protein
MSRRPAVVIRAAQVLANEHPYLQRLDPRAKTFFASRMARDAGLANVGVSRGRVAPGEATFAYHAHTLDEEWIYILEGRGVARIDGANVELAAGDFVAFPVPSVAHQLTNPYADELVYLFGGDDHGVDLLDYPDLGKRYAVAWDGRRAAFHPLGPAEYPFERQDAPTAAPWRIFGNLGWGNTIVECALTLAAIPFEREEVHPRTPGPALDRLRALNPAAEIPTVVLPDGSVMTESAALILYLSELAPDAGLAPPPGHRDRPQFLRWLTFFVAAIYPCFTYGDVATRYVTDGDELRRSTDARMQALWRQLEGAAQAPWFLGARFSALDLYVGVMTRWRPQRAWFAEHCPRLHAIAVAIDRELRLAPVMAANFP